ncbi:reverse transcriptase domain-containing protein [Tanacetum coccineum]
MHTRASNSELVEPLPEPERTLNRRLRRRNRRVPFEQRNNPPQHPRVVYPPILDINYFRHFLITLQNLNSMDDEPMWAADRVVALTLGFTITIPETANEFAIKGNHLTLVKGNQFDGSSSSDTDKIMARMDAMTMKIDAQYKDFQSRSKPNPDHNNDEIPMSREEEAKFMQTFCPKFDRFADKQSGRPSKSLPSNTQPNPKVNPNDQQNDSETPINFDSDDEPTTQPKPNTPKPVKETLIPKPYKPKIPYPQCLRKEKIEAQYGKFLDVIRTIRINIPLIDVLAGMPNYGKFLQELVNNKHKIEQISTAFLSDESFVILQNKVPPKLKDPGCFLIPCNFNKAFSCNALSNLGASINLMPYFLYAKLSLKILKPTKIRVRLADRSFQYPVGIAENMLVEVGKFIFLADFVILEMGEDSKVPLSSEDLFFTLLMR